MCIHTPKKSNSVLLRYHVDQTGTAIGPDVARRPYNAPVWSTQSTGFENWTLDLLITGTSTLPPVVCDWNNWSHYAHALWLKQRIDVIFHVWLTETFQLMTESPFFFLEFIAILSCWHDFTLHTCLTQLSPLTLTPWGGNTSKKIPYLTELYCVVESVYTVHN